MPRIFTPFLLVATTVSALAGEPRPAERLELPQPVDPPGAKCRVVQGESVAAAPVQLRQTFLDDFNNLELSLDGQGAGWRTHYPFNTYEQWQGRTLPGNREQQLYVDEGFRPQGAGLQPRNPFSVSNGVLTISARREAKPVGPFKDLKSVTHQFPFTSGLLSSYGRFAQRYGYFEVRAKLPLDAGLWPAFWMLRADKIQWPPEIDVIEINNRAPARPAGEGANVTHSKASGAHKADGCYIDTAEAASRFHTYGVLWTAEKMVFYVDRQPVTVAPTPGDMHDPMYLILNVAVGPNAGSQTPDSAALQADWIAAYTLE